VYRECSTSFGTCNATLESQGFSVKLASNGYDAIQMLEKPFVAAALLEYNQEGLDAEAVACHLKHRFPACDHSDLGLLRCLRESYEDYATSRIVADRLSVPKELRLSVSVSQSFPP